MKKSKSKLYVIAVLLIINLLFLTSCSKKEDKITEMIPLSSYIPTNTATLTNSAVLPDATPSPSSAAVSATPSKTASKATQTSIPLQNNKPDAANNSDKDVTIIKFKETAIEQRLQNYELDNQGFIDWAFWGTVIQNDKEYSGMFRKPASPKLIGDVHQIFSKKDHNAQEVLTYDYGINAKIQYHYNSAVHEKTGKVVSTMSTPDGKKIFGPMVRIPSLNDSKNGIYFKLNTSNKEDNELVIGYGCQSNKLLVSIIIGNKVYYHYLESYYSYMKSALETFSIKAKPNSEVTVKITTAEVFQTGGDAPVALSFVGIK